MLAPMIVGVHVSPCQGIAVRSHANEHDPSTGAKPNEATPCHDNEHCTVQALHVAH